MDVCECPTTLCGVYAVESDSGEALSNEKRLIKRLLSNYENVGVVGRPVRNTSETITVSFGLALIQILDLDEKNQILNTNVWSRYVRIRSLTSPRGGWGAVSRPSLSRSAVSKLEPEIIAQSLGNFSAADGLVRTRYYNDPVIFFSIGIF